MCIKEYMSFVCGHSTTPQIRPCPITSQNDQFHVCASPAERPWHMNQYCQPCGRVKWNEKVLQEENEHKHQHAIGVCNCGMIFRDLPATLPAPGPAGSEGGQHHNAVPSNPGHGQQHIEAGPANVGHHHDAFPGSHGYVPTQQIQAGPGNAGQHHDAFPGSSGQGHHTGAASGPIHINMHGQINDPAAEYARQERRKKPRSSKKGKEVMQYASDTYQTSAEHHSHRDGKEDVKDKKVPRHQRLIPENTYQPGHSNFPFRHPVMHEVKPMGNGSVAFHDAYGVLLTWPESLPIPPIAPEPLDPVWGPIFARQRDEARASDAQASQTAPLPAQGPSQTAPFPARGTSQMPPQGPAAVVEIGGFTYTLNAPSNHREDPQGMSGNEQGRGRSRRARPPPQQPLSQSQMVRTPQEILADIGVYPGDPRYEPGIQGMIEQPQHQSVIGPSQSGHPSRHQSRHRGSEHPVPVDPMSRFYGTQPPGPHPEPIQGTGYLCHGQFDGKPRWYPSPNQYDQVPIAQHAFRYGPGSEHHVQEIIEDNSVADRLRYEAAQQREASNEVHQPPTDMPQGRRRSVSDPEIPTQPQSFKRDREHNLAIGGAIQQGSAAGGSRRNMAAPGMMQPRKGKMVFPPLRPLQAAIPSPAPTRIFMAVTVPHHTGVGKPGPDVGHGVGEWGDMDDGEKQGGAEVVKETGKGKGRESHRSSLSAVAPEFRPEAGRAAVVVSGETGEKNDEWEDQTKEDAGKVIENATDVPTDMPKHESQISTWVKGEKLEGADEDEEVDPESCYPPMRPHTSNSV